MKRVTINKATGDVTFTGVLRKADEVDANGVMFSKECLVSLVDKLPKVGVIYDRDHNPVGLAFTVDKSYIEDDELCIDCKTLATDKGELLDALLEADHKRYTVGMAGTCSECAKQNGVRIIERFKATRVSVIPVVEKA